MNDKELIAKLLRGDNWRFGEVPPLVRRAAERIKVLSTPEPEPSEQRTVNQIAWANWWHRLNDLPAQNPRDHFMAGFEAGRVAGLEEAAQIAQKVVASWVVAERFKAPQGLRWPTEVTKWMTELTNAIRLGDTR